jgi:hypothetical protein
MLGNDFKVVGSSNDKIIRIESLSTEIILDLDNDDADHYKMDEFAEVIIEKLNSIANYEWVLAEFKAKKIKKMDETGDEYLYD